jgi:hypothetical protein
MEYKLQIVNQKGFVPAVILISLFTVTSMIATLLLTKNSYSLVFVIPIPILLFRFVQKKLSQTTPVIFKKEGILIKGDLYPYSEIEGYRWDTNLTMDGLGIKLKEKKVINYTISKLDKPKTNFKSFVKTFNSSIEKNTNINYEMNFSLIYKKKLWFLKPLFWIMTIVLIGLFGYALFKGLDIPSRFYLLPAVLFTLYIKAYK